MFEELFIQAIHDKKKIQLTFFSKEDGSLLIRTCAPMDFGPSRRSKDQSNRFHFWDYDSDSSMHTLSLLPNQVKNMQVLQESFSPSEFITWSTISSPWFVNRDWGTYS